jgi:hypothetical protein
MITKILIGLSLFLGFKVLKGALKWFVIVALLSGIIALYYFKGF